METIGGLGNLVAYEATPAEPGPSSPGFYLLTFAQPPGAFPSRDRALAGAQPGTAAPGAAGTAAGGRSSPQRGLHRVCGRRKGSGLKSVLHTHTRTQSCGCVTAQLGRRTMSWEVGECWKIQKSRRV